jgi:haloacetate dehalogenase
MFPNFKQKFINTSGATINVITRGKGFPLLLLHGYPQTHYMWHKIAPLLADEFTVVATDLRGYGDSSKPKGEPDHSNYSKQTLAQDQVEVMASLGYHEFFVVGHDRGARVAQRLALDYPQKVKKMILLDIVPTCKMYSLTDQDFATVYYHWFFLIQPYPLPETLINNNSEFFLRDCLARWSKDFSAFTPDAMSEYLRCFRDWNTIHGSCEDYRASATIDMEHDQTNLKKIACPLLILWGKYGFVGNRYDLLPTWWSYGSNVRGAAIDCGHFLPEEAPEETYFSIRDFLLIDHYF